MAHDYSRTDCEIGADPAIILRSHNMEEFIYRIRNIKTGEFLGGTKRMYVYEPDISPIGSGWEIVKYKLTEIKPVLPQKENGIYNE